MNILLINPYLNYGKLFYGFMRNFGSILPPLGIAYIAAYLEKEANFNVEIIDNQAENLNNEKLVDKIEKFDPQVVGISSITTQLLNTILTAKLIKKRLRNVKIVVGGPHATALPEELLNFCEEIDFIIIGEGEKPFYDLLKNIDDPSSLKNINGVVFKTKKGKITSKKPYFHQNLNDLPLPARHLLPMDNYRPTPVNYRKLPSRSLITSRGCPYNCSYCFKLCNGGVRYLSEKNVIDEILQLETIYNAKELIFWDDCFFFNKKRLTKLFGLMNNQNIEIPWMAMARIDQINKKWLIKAKKNGCWRIGFGVESADYNVLRKMNKSIPLSKISEIINFSKKIGIETRVFFILGTPYDNKRSIEKTISFSKKLDPDTAQFSYYVPFPGTRDYDYVISNHEDFDPKYYLKNVYPDYHNLDKLMYVPPTLTESELRKYHRLAYFNYYFRFKFVAQTIRKTKNLSELYKNLAISFGIIDSMVQKMLD